MADTIIYIIGTVIFVFLVLLTISSGYVAENGEKFEKNNWLIAGPLITQFSIAIGTSIGMFSGIDTVFKVVFGIFLILAIAAIAVSFQLIDGKTNFENKNIAAGFAGGYSSFITIIGVFGIALGWLVSKNR